MKKKNVKVDRRFNIEVYNSLHDGMSYPELAEKLDIPPIKAFKIFNAVIGNVNRSPKLKLECLAYRCAKNSALGDRALYNLKLRGITTYDDLVEVSKADIKKVMEAVRSWEGVGEKIASIIFKMLKEVKGGNA